MVRFFYKGFLNNEKISGDILAKDQSQALLLLETKDIRVISLKKQNILMRDIVLSHLNKKELSFFCRQLLFFVSTGVSLMGITDIPSSKKIEKSFFVLKENIMQGHSLSKSLELEKFPVLLCNMIKVGEATGRLDQILEQMEHHYEKEYENAREIKSVLVYPVMIIVAMVLVMTITMLYLVPSFTSMFIVQGVELPTMTRGLIMVSDFFAEGWFFLWAILMGVSIGVLYRFKKLDKLVFELPLIKNMARVAITARFSSAMAVMMKAGVPIVEAVDITKGLFKNSIYKEKIETVKEHISKGHSLKNSFEKTRLFHPLLISLVKLGEETGTLVSSLEKASVYFEKEQTVIIKNLKKHIEPAITILMGLMLLFIMLAIMLPTFSIMQVM